MNEWQIEWAEYEHANRKANARYKKDKVTIDARYDPHGGGRRTLDSLRPYKPRKKKDT